MFMYAHKDRLISQTQVMQVHMSVDDLVVCAPLSLLPQLKFGEKTPSENLQAIQDFEPPKALQELRKEDAICKEISKDSRQKVPTRQKLLALNLSFRSLLNLRLVDFQPAVAFRAPKPSEKRAYYVDHNGQRLAYLWDSCSKVVVPQSCAHDDFSKVVRCCCLADEGDYTANLAMCEAGLAIFPHRDCEHKLAREEVLAIKDVAEIDLAISEIFLVLKHDAAPWGQGMFGRRLKEAYARVHELPVPHVLLDLVGGSMIVELGLPPNTSQEELKTILIDFARVGGKGGGDHKLGRWSDFIDSFGHLRKVWSVKLFFILFAKALEGLNPFTAIAESTQTPRDEKNMPIAPRVLRVSSLHTVRATFESNLADHEQQL